MLKLYNTPHRALETFEPLSLERVTLYTCGPTVYNRLHVGNWVAYIRWDTLVRTLRANGYHVERVMNITDVGHLVSDADEGEDKMQKGARREHITMSELAERYSRDFFDGMRMLGLLMPQHVTKATEFISEQIALIKRLEEKGYTYVIDDGVYFDTTKFPAYGDFARLDVAGLKEGARIGTVEGRRNPSDFALWKFDRTGTRTEMVWDSPWGRGFPGWHLECSAMAMACLGETIDIHTGGIDHIPVHHTNEIAQSEAATGKPFARYWLHANFLTVDGTKISKSLDNGFTLDDLQARGFSAYDFKMFVLQSHYRTESNFTWDNLAAAQSRLRRWRDVAVLRWQVSDQGAAGEARPLPADAAAEHIVEQLNDDLMTPKALVEAERALETYALAAPLNEAEAQELGVLIGHIDELLGLDVAGSTPDVGDDIKALLDERRQAREQSDWVKSDGLRDQLRSLGVAVNDTPRGQLWTYL